MTARSIWTKLTSSIPILACFAFATALFGQIDAEQLRAKYGQPLARETFTLSPGLEITVDYGPSQHVCRLNFPGSSASPIQQHVDDALLELAPMSMRGKEIGTMFEFAGRASITIMDYEHVSIAESQDPDHPGHRTGVTVVFKRDECRDR